MTEIAGDVREITGRFRVMANFRERAEEWEENGWVARARAGDEAGYRWLLDRYRARVVRLAAHVLRRPAEAEDVAQESFLRAFRKLHTFRSEGRFYTWLYHIVIRVCLDRRRLARWDRESESLPEDDVDWRMESKDSVAGMSDPRLLVESLLDQLSPSMRATLVLRELEGMEYEEIALAMGVPVGTVRSRLHAARERFRTLWTSVQEEARNV